jgi:peptidyl-prolyl cis-trans isomerase B (cyclophilin B)
MKMFFRFLAPLFLAVSSLSVYAEGGLVLPQVKLETSHGVITIELNAEKAPNTVDNFLAYVNEGFYNGTIFHRVIKDFMIQGGGFTEEFVQKSPNAPIKNEANNGLSNVRGSLAMARTGDPHSATAQFFINTVDNAFLDFRAEQGAAWGYAVFGEVIEGMDVVDAIRIVDTTNKGAHQDVPSDNVVIINATVVE